MVNDGKRTDSDFDEMSIRSHSVKRVLESRILEATKRIL